MKTSNKVNGLDARNLDQAAKYARRQRVLTAIDCESLEGRKLMTGFSGTSAATMGHGPAEVSGMGGDQFARGDWQRFDAGSDGGGADDAQATTDDGQTVAHSSIRVDHQSVNGSTTGDASDRSGRPDLMMKNDLADRSFGGDSQDRGMGGDFDDRGMGGDRGDFIPMGGQADAGTQGQGSTGNTQFDTDLTKLQTDEQAIHDKSQVTPVLQAAVRKDLEAIDKAATGTADATATKTEQTDQQTIFATKTMPTDAQQAQLQADHDAVLKSEGVSQTLIDQLAADRLAVKTASNFTAADQATLDADHKALDADRASSTATTTDPSGSTSSTTATTTTTAAATTTAATPALATTSTDTTDSAATPPTDPAAPATPAPASDAATTATPPTTAGTDPTMTQTTTTATPTMGLGSMAHRHGRGGMGQAGEMHSDDLAGSARSFTAHQGGMGHSFSHSTSFEGRGGRDGRN